MDHHLGYEKSERSDSDDYRNGYKSKTVKSRFGKMEIEVPQNRRSTFEPQVVKKRSEKHKQHRLKKYFDVCKRNDHPPDFRHYPGHLWI